MKKKLLAALLCVAMTVSLTACGGSSASTDTAADAGTTEAGAEAGTTATGDVPAHKEELIIGTAVDINSLDLQNQSDQINNICLKLTHQTLFDLDADTNRIPCLATEATWIDDNTIEIKLVENACFSDGTPLTAEDVKFTFDMALESPVAGNLTGLISTDVVDDYTVHMNMESYSNDFMMSLTYIPFGIQSKAAYESGMEEPFKIGSGQYVFDEWLEGEQVSFVKNENYWGSDPGVSDRITFKPYLEASSRVIALQNGEIDVCIDPPANELQYLEEDENITVYEQAGTRLFYFAFNCEKAPWDNQTLRQAVACAIDRDAVLQAAVYGKGTPQTTILNRGLFGFYDDMEGFDYDVERAKSLMAEAGYADGGITTTLTIANSSPYTNIAQVIQANLKEIGIDVEITTMEDATLKSTCKEGGQELFLWRWNEDIRPDCVYRDLFNTGSGSNYHHFSDPKVDELTDKVLTDKDEAQRTEDSKELQTYLVDACPQVPLYISNLVIAYNKNLVMPYFRGGGDHYWKNAYVAE
ncbi:MAG: ABC transporter substrate-binding protein [Lachnospiraceae bacterium]|nr:ABC transporter substrate-binding protein [Lachnospiraceae bacterium]